MVLVQAVFFLLATCAGSNAVDVHINSEDVKKLLQLEWTLLGIIDDTKEAEVVRQDILEFQPPFRPEMAEHPLNVNILKS